jgi:hypothetical protein
MGTNSGRNVTARSNPSESTVRDFKKGRRVLSINNLAAIRHALESRVEFIDDDQSGCRLMR